MTKTKLLSAAVLTAGILLGSATAQAGASRRARRQPAPTQQKQPKQTAVTPEGETCTLVSRSSGNGGKGSYKETVCAETGKPPVKQEARR